MALACSISDEPPEVRTALPATLPHDVLHRQYLSGIVYDGMHPAFFRRSLRTSSPPRDRSVQSADLA